MSHQIISPQYNPYYKILYSKEFNNISLRPKMEIVYDIAEYIKIIAPDLTKKIRPTGVTNIAWYSNLKEKFKIELLKNGVIVDVIAENVETSPYAWKFAQHRIDRGDFDFKVFNLRGKLVHSENRNIIGAKTVLIPVYNFLNGIYIIRCKYLGKILTKTVVISK